MSAQVVTIGEALLRLSPPAGEPLETASRYTAHVGGSEANVAVALAGLGVPAAWWSALPDNALGRRVARELRAAGVDLSGVQWAAEGRMGLYFYEAGPSPRVIYDRAASTAARLAPEQLDWRSLQGARFLHLSGITAAVNLELARAAVCQARRLGVAVSFDLNYRQRLWDVTRARAALEELVSQADLLFCSRADAAAVLGVTGDRTEVAAELARRCGTTWTVVTDGGTGAALNGPTGLVSLPAWPAPVIDRPGAGDALAAGVLFGLTASPPAPADPLSCGLALAARKLGQAGDQVSCTREDLTRLLSQTDTERWR